MRFFGRITGWAEDEEEDEEEEIDEKRPEYIRGALRPPAMGRERRCWCCAWAYNNWSRSYRLMVPS